MCGRYSAWRLDALDHSLYFDCVSCSENDIGDSGQSVSDALTAAFPLTTSIVLAENQLSTNMRLIK